MGYTHYYRIPAKMKEAKFSKFVADAKKIIKQAEKNGIKLADGYGEKKGKYILTDDLVSFNGLDSDSHETCYIERTEEGVSSDENELVFNFCKTARKPYDEVVVAVLATLKHHFPKVELSSDGEVSNFVQGEKLVEQALGKKFKFKL